ncbi:MAG TPA: small, acid-soluble spore protein, alpha/beta type [Symbiobacteriaceae bacterium]|nr:small, acid-soluble spore protein, alpha/beta type [Symbiobacteriaceae bacterium]
MARNRRSLLSDSTKLYLAQLQGAADRVAPGDYGNLTSREAGNFVKYAIASVEQSLSGQAPAARAIIPQAGQVR